MLFNSPEFLYFFLPITFFVFWRLSSKQSRYVWLTITGYVFYSFWNYKFCALMLFSTLVSYAAGVGLAHFQDVRRRRFCMVASIAVDLSVLGFFKYYNFFADNLNSFAVHLIGPELLPVLSVTLPIGISFYTFHTISYVVDCYRGQVRATKNFFEFSCYVSLFSQLVAGPIVRFGEIEKDLEAIDEHKGVSDSERAWYFICCGMIKKVLIADSIASIIDPAFANYHSLSTLEVWLLALGYSYQLYFDFSGYSDLAVGLGQLFNLRIPQNFNSPYLAIDIRDFWRRWHISLSRCMKDYLYVPMGGSRFGSYKTLRNIMLTMLIGGLWHGANWTFVIWGLYHGILLVLTHIFQKQISYIPHILQRFITFVLVVLGFLIFRAESISMARELFFKLVGSDFSLNFNAFPGLFILLTISAILAHFCRNTFEKGRPQNALEKYALIFLFAVSLVFVSAGRPSPFLYFQF